MAVGALDGAASGSFATGAPGAGTGEETEGGDALKTWGKIRWKNDVIATL